LRRAAAEAIGTDPERILLCASHTHSGPTPVTPELAEKWEMKYDPADPPPEFAYTEALSNKVVQTVSRAEALTYPATLWLRQAPFGIAYNRRAQTARGLKHCWSPQQFLHRQPETPVDVTCSALVFRQMGSSRSFLLWSTGAHPVVLGKTSRVVSADYPGIACRLIEEYLPDARPLFVLGACGDTQPWIATQEEAAALMPVARAAASFVTLLSLSARPVAHETTPRIRCATDVFTAGKRELDLCVWRIGPIRILAVPAEVFSASAAALRDRIPGDVIIASNSNGASGYWPHRGDFAQGGYEVNTTKKSGIVPGDTERLIDALVELAASLD
jgi:hypothetical protein